MADKKISALTGAATPLAGTEVLPIVQSGSTVKVSVANLTAGRAVNASSLTASGNIQGDTVNFGTSFGQLTWDTGVAIIQGSAGKDVVIRTQGSSTNRLSVGASDVTVGTGNLVIGTAGKGIDFSANTHAAGMTSELLNWYEEGVWTPVVRGAATAGTYELNTSVTKATYTRIGRVVHLSAYIVLAGAITGGGTGELTIFGVPFAKGANIPAFGVTSFSGVDFAAGANLSCYFGTTASSSQLFIWETNDNAGVSLTPISGVSAGDTINISITYEV
jgi:hypothetical protein